MRALVSSARKISMIKNLQLTVIKLFACVRYCTKFPIEVISFNFHLILATTL